MLTQIAFKRGPVELVEHGVKVIFRLFERIFLPLAFYADLLILGSVHTSHYLIDNGIHNTAVSSWTLRFLCKRHEDFL